MRGPRFLFHCRVRYIASAARGNTSCAFVVNTIHARALATVAFVFIILSIIACETDILCFVRESFFACYFV